MAKYWSHRTSAICTVICAFAASGRSEIASVSDKFHSHSRLPTLSRIVATFQGARKCGIHRWPLCLPCRRPQVLKSFGHHDDTSPTACGRSHDCLRELGHYIHRIGGADIVASWQIVRRHFHRQSIKPQDLVPRQLVRGARSLASRTMKHSWPSFTAVSVRARGSGVRQNGEWGSRAESFLGILFASKAPRFAAMS